MVEFEPESERVARRLRAEILDGVRPPGSKLVERDIAAGLGVSRVPVRDALRVLVGEGLVTPRPRSWSVVREFTASDIADLHEVRTAIEPLAFRLAAQRHTRDGLRRLRAAVAEETAAADAGDPVRARRAAGDFHELVVELAGNELLAEVERSLRSRLRWLLAQHDDLHAIAGQHAALCAAIAARDLALVDRLVADHLVTGYQHATGRHT